MDEKKEENKHTKITLEPHVRARYESAQYGIAGNHSGVQICSWMRKSLRGKGVCYKQKFYGIDCFRCCQMSPALAWCEQNCTFCWRPMEWMQKVEMKEDEIDDPEEIIDSCVQKRKKQMSGIGGAQDVNRSAFDLSFNSFPSHWAISLSGEPTIYPKIGELIRKLRERKEVRSIFLVTNGQEPQRLEQMAKEGTLPTQLYVSLVACDEELFKKINKPVYPDGWARLNKTLGMLKGFGLGETKCRTVIRFTVIKDLNDSDEQLTEFAKIFERTQSDFIEIKSYMHLGLSRERLERANMPTHDEIKERAQKLLEMIPGYRLEDEDPQSRIVLLKWKESKVENIIRKA